MTELKAYLGPVIEALRHRMEVYCEQNRVSMTGEILDEAQEGARLTDEDITGWLDKAHAYNVWKHHSEFTSCGPVSDEERIQFRNMPVKAEHPYAQDMHTYISNNSEKFKLEFLKVYNGKCAYCGVSVDLIKKNEILSSELHKFRGY